MCFPGSDQQHFGLHFDEVAELVEKSQREVGVIPPFGGNLVAVQSQAASNLGFHLLGKRKGITVILSVQKCMDLKKNLLISNQHRF